MGRVDGGLVVGRHNLDGKIGQVNGNPVPVTSMPAWGGSAPAGESGVVGRLGF